MFAFNRFLAATLGLLALSAISPATAQDNPAKKVNVLIVSEDNDTETVPRGNRMFNRVIATLQETLNVRYFQVYDENSVAASFTQPGKVRRSDVEMIEIARAVRPPMDVLIVFQVYASARKANDSDIVRPEIRIPGRILDLRSGQAVGNFEVGGFELPPLPRNCDRECLLEKVGDEARILGTNLAGALGDKLEGFIKVEPAAAPAAPVQSTVDPKEEALDQPAPVATAPASGCVGFPTTYSVSLEGFLSEEIGQMEELMDLFRCRTDIRRVRGSGNFAEYSYGTRLDTTKLDRNLRQALDFLGIKGEVVLSGSGSGGKFLVRKIATR
jgi:hypothetical protein